MADPLSIAAAAAGFAGLAGQLAGGILKLKDMCATVKSAPEALSTLCSRMELLRSLLEEAGRQIQSLSSDDVDKMTAQEVFTQCEEARYKIAARVEDLSKQVHRNRAAAVKFLLKKKEIQEMLSDVEQCKTDLIIARQTIEATISSRRHGVLFHKQVLFSQNQTQLLEQAARVSQQISAYGSTSTNEFRSIKEEHRESSSKICQSIRNLQDHLDTQQKNDSTPVIVAGIENIQRDIQASNSRFEASVFGRLDAIEQRTTGMATRKTKSMKFAFQSVLFNFSVDISSEREDQAEKEVAKDTTITQNIGTIRLPRWFVRDQHNLMIKRAKSGWLFRPTIYRTVDGDCSFFRTCKIGDLDTIRTLLSTKQAFLSDRAHEYGITYSALTHAMRSHQLDVCRLLVNAGILNQFQDSDYEDALSLFAYEISMTTTRSNDFEILRLIEPKSDQIGESYYGWLDEFRVSAFARRAISDLRFSVDKFGESPLIRFEASFFNSTMEVHGLLNSETYTIHRLYTFLQDDDHVKEIRSAGPACTWLIFALASGLAAAPRWWNHERDEAVEQTRYVLTMIKSAGIDIHASLGSLPEEWHDLLGYRSYMVPWEVDASPFCTLVISAIHDRFGDGNDDASEKMQLWALALSKVGVDLEEYAREEVWRLERALKKIKKMGAETYGVLYGPDPSDWGLRRSLPGEASLEYFWRAIESTPIVQELAMKVSAAREHVRGQNTFDARMPGRWQEDNSILGWLRQVLERWLACMEDSGLAQVEVDLEELSPASFCEKWDVESVVKEWCSRWEYHNIFLGTP